MNKGREKKRRKSRSKPVEANSDKKNETDTDENHQGIFNSAKSNPRS